MLSSRLSKNATLEGQADRVADAVLRLPEPRGVQRKCAECEAEEQLQHQDAGRGAAAGRMRAWRRRLARLISRTKPVSVSSALMSRLPNLPCSLVMVCTLTGSVTLNITHMP
jgi:hypothetical protein